MALKSIIYGTLAIKLVDVKTGYDGTTIKESQILNYAKILLNPDKFDALKGKDALGLEYIFLPGQKGKDAAKAAGDARNKIREVLKDNSLFKELKNKIKIKYLDNKGKIQTLAL